MISSERQRKYNSTNVHSTVVWSACILLYFIFDFEVHQQHFLSALWLFFSIYTCQKDVSELWDPARPLEMVLNCYFFSHGGAKGWRPDKWWERLPNFTSTVEREKKAAWCCWRTRPSPTWRLCISWSTEPVPGARWEVLPGLVTQGGCEDVYKKRDQQQQSRSSHGGNYQMVDAKRLPHVCPDLKRFERDLFPFKPTNMSPFLSLRW